LFYWSNMVAAETRFSQRSRFVIRRPTNYTPSKIVVYKVVFVLSIVNQLVGPLAAELRRLYPSTQRIQSYIESYVDEVLPRK